MRRASVFCLFLLICSALFLSNCSQSKNTDAEAKSDGIIVSVNDNTSLEEADETTPSEEKDSTSTPDYAPQVRTFSVSNEDGSEAAVISDCYHLTGDTLLWVELSGTYDRVDFVAQPVSGSSSQLQQVIGSVRSDGTSTSASYLWEHRRSFQGYVWAVAYRGSVATRTE